MITAEEVRQLMFKEFSNKIDYAMVEGLIKKQALEGKFKLRIEQKDFGGDVELLAKYLRTLNYQCQIELYYGGFPKEARILVINW